MPYFFDNYTNNVLDKNNYENLIQSYIPKDAFIALGYYCFYFLTVILSAVLVVNAGINIGTLIQMLNFAACIFIVKMRKQNLVSLGISRNRLLINILWGITIGLLFLVINIFIFKNSIIIEKLNFYMIFYYFVIIAFIEEVTFRGYIQSRVCALIKKRMNAVLFVGILSAILHIPFDIVNSHKGILELILSWSFCFQFMTRIIAHVILYFLYQKFNSFIPATILHGLIDII